MTYMKSCCCSCCSVGTGTKILSILGIIGYSAELFGTISGCRNVDYRELQKHIPVDKLGVTGIYDFLVFHAVFCAAGIVACILCLVGAFQKRRNFLIPYLVFQALVLVELAVVVIFLLVFVGLVATVTASIEDNKDTVDVKAILIPIIVSFAVALLITVFLSIYYYVVVLSHYKELVASEQNPQPPIAYTAVPVNAPPGYPCPGAPPGHTPQGGFYPTLPEHKGDAV